MLVAGHGTPIQWRAILRVAVVVFRVFLGSGPSSYVLLCVLCCVLRPLVQLMLRLMAFPFALHRSAVECFPWRLNATFRDVLCRCSMYRQIQRILIFLLLQRLVVRCYRRMLELW